LSDNWEKNSLESLEKELCALNLSENHENEELSTIQTLTALDSIGKGSFGGEEA
jgi:hypothetical protein